MQSTSGSGRATGLPPGLAAALRAAVVALAAVLLVAASIALVREVRDLDRIAAANARLSYADRDVAGGNGVLPEQRAAYELRGRIPRDAAYTIRVGPRRDGWTDLTSGSIEPFLRYWLLPRRSASDAEWVVCVGCDPRALGAGVSEVWSGEAGVRLLRRTG